MWRPSLFVNVTCRRVPQKLAVNVRPKDLEAALPTQQSGL
jgi:hypothetical protein